MPVKRRRNSPAKRPQPDPADPRFIPAIHHYCDRWCERCEFSHRCFKFAFMEASIGRENAAREGGTQTVFDAIARSLDEARHELAVLSAEQGVPIDEAALLAGIAVEKRIERRAQRTGARETKAAQTYALMVDEWFNNELRLPLQFVRGMDKRIRMGAVRLADAKGDLVRLNDCVEVIRWHQHLPYVKLCRAFSSRVEEDTMTGRIPRRDSDGSAKVALLSLDQSIEAWTVLREMFPEKTDSVLEILVHLDRLRRGIEAKFPRARKFKRPGFDEPMRRRK